MTLQSTCINLNPDDFSLQLSMLLQLRVREDRNKIVESMNWYRVVMATTSIEDYIVTQAFNI